MPYEVVFAASVKPQLDALTAKQRTTLLDAIEKQLIHEPLTETRNRKLLRPNPIAPWELRVGQLRVFYEVAEHDPNADEPPETAGTVHVLALGRKKGSVLWIGEEKVEL
jgi:mRNA-degrading endonuclease RelE of RelBE toxin-antitoxin system